MDCLRRLEHVENIPRARHYLRDRSNAMEDLEDYEFSKRFRFSKDTVISILDMIKQDINREANIPPMFC